MSCCSTPTVTGNAPTSTRWTKGRPPSGKSKKLNKKTPWERTGGGVLKRPEGGKKKNRNETGGFIRRATETLKAKTN